MSHQKPFKFVLSLWQGASSHSAVLDTFWTRDICHEAYSLAFYKDLNNLQNLDPAAVSNKCSPDCIAELEYSVVAVWLQHYVFVSV